MNAVVALKKIGYAFSVKNKKLAYRWTRPEPPEPAQVSVHFDALKRQKRTAIEYLAALPGYCDCCPAAGTWDGFDPAAPPGTRLCFHYAYFDGKPGRPTAIQEAARACPKQNKNLYSE